MSWILLAWSLIASWMSSKKVFNESRFKSSLTSGGMVFTVVSWDYLSISTSFLRLELFTLLFFPFGLCSSLELASCTMKEPRLKEESFLRKGVFSSNLKLLLLTWSSLSDDSSSSFYFLTIFIFTASFSFSSSLIKKASWNFFLFSCFCFSIFCLISNFCYDLLTSRSSLDALIDLDYFRLNNCLLLSILT